MDGWMDGERRVVCGGCCCICRPGTGPAYIVSLFTRWDKRGGRG